VHAASSGEMRSRRCPRRPDARPSTPLNRERVLRAALALADQNGIESLTMRKLGEAVGVEAMSLYNHVAN
jgi:AcrR family transcriptional regulator